MSTAEAKRWTIVKRKAKRMGRFHHALQQLARRGHFAMAPREPLVHHIPVPRGLRTRQPTPPRLLNPHPALAGAEDESRAEGISSAVCEQPGSHRTALNHPIQIAAALPQLRVDLAPVAPPEGDRFDPPARLDQAGRVEFAFEPLVVDTGLRRELGRLPRSRGELTPSSASENAIARRKDNAIARGQDDATPYRPVLSRWAVLTDEGDAVVEKDGQNESCMHAGPSTISGSDGGPSTPVESHLATLPPERGDALSSRTPSQTSESTRLPATEYETEIARRLQSLSYRQHLQTLHAQVIGDAAEGPSIVLLASIDNDDRRAEAAAAWGVFACEKATLPTLLIDADIDSRHLSQRFHREGPGLIEAISGQSPWQGSVRQTSRQKLSLLPCGTDIAFVSPDTGQEEFRQLFQFAGQWREQFGLVVIDGGHVDSPLIPVLAEISDSAFVCVQLGTSRREDLLAAVERLETAGANVQGCIITGGAE